MAAVGRFGCSVVLDGGCGQVWMLCGYDRPLRTVLTVKHLTFKQTGTGGFLSFEDILKNIV